MNMLWLLMKISIVFISKNTNWILNPNSNPCIHLSMRNFKIEIGTVDLPKPPTLQPLPPSPTVDENTPAPVSFDLTFSQNLIEYIVPTCKFTVYTYYKIKQGEHTIFSVNDKDNSQSAFSLILNTDNYNAPLSYKMALANGRIHIGSLGKIFEWRSRGSADIMDKWIYLIVTFDCKQFSANLKFLDDGKEYIAHKINLKKNVFLGKGKELITSMVYTFTQNVADYSNNKFDTLKYNIFVPNCSVYNNINVDAPKHLKCETCATGFTLTQLDRRDFCVTAGSSTSLQHYWNKYSIMDDINSFGLVTSGSCLQYNLISDRYWKLYNEKEAKWLEIIPLSVDYRNNFIHGNTIFLMTNWVKNQIVLKGTDNVIPNMIQYSCNACLNNGTLTIYINGVSYYTLSYTDNSLYFRIPSRNVNAYMQNYVMGSYKIKINQSYDPTIAGINLCAEPKTLGQGYECQTGGCFKCYGSNLSQFPSNNCPEAHLGMSGLTNTNINDFENRQYLRFGGYDTVMHFKNHFSYASFTIHQGEDIDGTYLLFGFSLVNRWLQVFYTVDGSNPPTFEFRHNRAAKDYKTMTELNKIVTYGKSFQILMHVHEGNVSFHYPNSKGSCPESTNIIDAKYDKIESEITAWPVDRFTNIVTPFPPTHWITGIVFYSQYHNVKKIGTYDVNFFYWTVHAQKNIVDLHRYFIHFFAKTCKVESFDRYTKFCRRSMAIRNNDLSIKKFDCTLCLSTYRRIWNKTTRLHECKPITPEKKNFLHNYWIHKWENFNRGFYQQETYGTYWYFHYLYRFKNRSIDLFKYNGKNNGYFKGVANIGSDRNISDIKLSIKACETCTEKDYTIQVKPSERYMVKFFYKKDVSLNFCIKEEEEAKAHCIDILLESFVLDRQVVLYAKYWWYHNWAEWAIIPEQYLNTLPLYKIAKMPRYNWGTNTKKKSFVLTNNEYRSLKSNDHCRYGWQRNFSLYSSIKLDINKSSDIFAVSNGDSQLDNDKFIKVSYNKDNKMIIVTVLGTVNTFSIGFEPNDRYLQIAFTSSAGKLAIALKRGSEKDFTHAEIINLENWSRISCESTYIKTYNHNEFYFSYFFTGKYSDLEWVIKKLRNIMVGQFNCELVEPRGHCMSCGPGYELLSSEFGTCLANNMYSNGYKIIQKGIHNSVDLERVINGVSFTSWTFATTVYLQDFNALCKPLIAIRNSSDVVLASISLCGDILNLNILGECATKIAKVEVAFNRWWGFAISIHQDENGRVTVVAGVRDFKNLSASVTVSAIFSSPILIVNENLIIHWANQYANTYMVSYVAKESNINDFIMNGYVGVQANVTQDQSQINLNISASYTVNCVELNQLIGSYETFMFNYNYQSEQLVGKEDPLASILFACFNRNLDVADKSPEDLATILTNKSFLIITLDQRGTSQFYDISVNNVPSGVEINSNTPSWGRVHHSFSVPDNGSKTELNTSWVNNGLFKFNKAGSLNNLLISKSTKCYIHPHLHSGLGISANESSEDEASNLQDIVAYFETSNDAWPNSRKCTDQNAVICENGVSVVCKKHFQVNQEGVCIAKSQGLGFSQGSDIL